MAAQQTPAVILATRSLGEADLLVVLLTPDAGKIRAAARHARKSRRRFPGGLPGGAIGHATLESRRTGLWRLEGWTHGVDLTGLGRDLERLAHVAYLCELTDVLVDEPEPDPLRFVALEEAVRHTISHGTTPAVLRRYELRLLRSLGWLPSLGRCCVCGIGVCGAASAGASDPVPFDAHRGGVLCPRHARGAQVQRPQVLGLAEAMLLAADQARAAATLDAAAMQDRRALRDLCRDLVRTHLSRPLRALGFFAQLRESASPPRSD